MRPLDLYVLYSFIRKLSTPFNEWRMYKAGVIDENGNFLVPKERRTQDQLDSYSYLDILILNLKRTISVIPGANTRIATFAAALYLLREPKPLSEEMVEYRTKLFEDKYDSLLNEAAVLVENEGGAVAANNMGGGEVAQKDNPMNVNKMLKRKHNLTRKEKKSDA